MMAATRNLLGRTEDVQVLCVHCESWCQAEYNQCKLVAEAQSSATRTYKSWVVNSLSLTVLLTFFFSHKTICNPRPFLGFLNTPRHFFTNATLFKAIQAFSWAILLDFFRVPNAIVTHIYVNLQSDRWIRNRGHVLCADRDTYVRLLFLSTPIFSTYVYAIHVARFEWLRKRL